MSGPTLHRKLAEVYAIVERIPKKGTAPAEMGGYPFVQVGDAADPIRKALGERHLTMLPAAIEIVGQSEHTDSRQRIVTTCDVRVTWTIADGESGESATLQSMGSGQDRGDKYVPKALTNAMKYAILLGFLLPTGDDPERDRTDDRTPRAAPRSAPSSPAGAPAEPTLVPLGIEAHNGQVIKGDGQHNDVAYHQTPEGHRIGFKLGLADGKALPQVICDGPIGEAMYVTIPVEELLGADVRVVGEAFRVETPGRRPYRRLVVSEIEGPGFRIPATDTTPSEIAAPGGSGAGTDELDSLPW